MKILMPFWQLGNFDRYLPQMKAISERIDEFNIAYFRGDVAKDWGKHFQFHKVNMPYTFVKSKTVRWGLSRGKVYEQLKDIDVDLYYTLSDFLSQDIARYIASRSSRSYVVRLRGNHKASREAREVPYHKRKFLNHYEARSLRDANLVVPISSKLVKFAKECGVKESKVTEAVPIGVDVKHFKPRITERSNGFTVGYAGRISLEKGILRLMELARKLPSIRFLVAGKKETETEFPINVRYKGSLPFDEMPRFYNECDLVILPSLTEGFPCVILEAYACGKPILATPEAFPEELQVFGAVGNIDAFPGIIKAVQEQPLESIGKKAREYVAKYFTWEEFGKSMKKYLS